MPSGTHEVELDIPLHSIWEFVSDMNNWAPLVPGYMDHEIINDTQSTWKFKGDLGIMQKKIHLQVDITKWQEPNLVTFNLKGLNENFTGNGYFKAEALSETKTKMTGNLDITAGGMMARVVNPVLKSFVPKTANELTDNIADKLKELHSITK